MEAIFYLPLGQSHRALYAFNCTFALDYMCTCALRSFQDHMATLPQIEKQAVISFRCDADFKKAVDRALIDKEMSLQEAGTEAFARFLKLEKKAAGGPPPRVSEKPARPAA